MEKTFRMADKSGSIQCGGKRHGGEDEDLKYLNHMYFPAESK